MPNQFSYSTVHNVELSVSRSFQAPKISLSDDNISLSFDYEDCETQISFRGEQYEYKSVIPPIVIVTATVKAEKFDFFNPLGQFESFFLKMAEDDINAIGSDWYWIVDACCQASKVKSEFKFGKEFRSIEDLKVLVNV